MEQAEALLLEMEMLLHELITIAKKLCDSSQSALSKDDLDALQLRQKELLHQLIDADITFTRITKGQVNSYQSPAKNRVSQLLQDFQVLNQSFIEAVSDAAGLIHFNKKSSS